MLTKLIAHINDRVIEARVRGKEEAREKYDDTIAAGNVAVLADRDTIERETMTIILGNLNPNQQARL